MELSFQDLSPHQQEEELRNWNEAKGRVRVTQTNGTISYGDWESKDTINIYLRFPKSPVKVLTGEKEVEILPIRIDMIANIAAAHEPAEILNQFKEW